MKVIIAASGSQQKWGGHLGVPSHFAPLTRHEGKPLILRTIERVLRYTQDVHVLTPPNPLYATLPGTKHIIQGYRQSEYEASRMLWEPEGRTILLLGDVYFSDLAMERIFRYTKRQYMVFGRKGPSRITGTPYGEIFAASWYGEHNIQMDKHLERVHKLRAEGTITRPPGWMLLRAWQGTPLGKHKVLTKHFMQIDDWTDDIDFPVDYERHPATRSN